MSFQWMMFLKRFSAQRLEQRKISFGKMLHPTGIVMSSIATLLKLSQYKRPEDAALPDSQ
jgi:hypothetical protein